MKIPDQILSVLKGTDVILIPPENEGTVPTPSEQFVKAYLEPLLALGLQLATDDADPEVVGDESYLLFNPSFFDANLIQAAAEQSRLAEFVNGLGNNAKPANPIAMVRVFNRNSGEPVRDILTDTPETTMTAAQRNVTQDNDVSVEAATTENLINTLTRR